MAKIKAKTKAVTSSPMESHRRGKKNMRPVLHAQPDIQTCSAVPSAADESTQPSTDLRWGYVRRKMRPASAREESPHRLDVKMEKMDLDPNIEKMDLVDDLRIEKMEVDFEALLMLADVALSHENLKPSYELRCSASVIFQPEV